jgi:tungstate transport system ATP-binding protein
MNNQPELRIHALYKSFADRIVLSGVDLTLRRGQCYLLSGANGTGKTTLLRIVAGLEKPDASRIDLGRGEMKWKRCRSALQSRILYLHQHPYMFDGSVKYNLSYALPQRLGQAVRDQRIGEALAWAGLLTHGEVSAKRLSGGERQQVALARAWLKKPEVLLLDEPTANMDQEARRRTLDLLFSLKAEAMSLLIASHDPTQFTSLVDNHIHLDAGKIIHLNRQQPAPGHIPKITPIRSTLA